MTIAVIFLTCGRLDLTRRTLETFSAMNPDARERFLLLHADDASAELAEIRTLVQAHGFETVVTHATRRGYRTGRTEAITIAAARGADWVLVMENDYDWVRPFPWALMAHLSEAHPEVYCLRLYGRYKGRDHQNPCMTIDLSRGRRPVTWRPLLGAPDATEVTRIHWGAPLAVTRMAEMLRLQAEPIRPGYDPRGDTQPEVLTSGAIKMDVARVLTNVAYHVGGGHRTPRPGVVVRAPRLRGHAPWELPRRNSDTPRLCRPRPRPGLYTPAWQETRGWTAEGSTRCLDETWRSLGLPGSLLDVGCGDGHLVTRAQARSIDAVGLDLSCAGDAGPLRHADLRMPVDLGRTFDLVLCWEVAEHLPAESADVLCDTLVRHLTPAGVLLFTAATPGQGGPGHVHEQPVSYWRDRLTASGLIFDASRTAELSQTWTQVAPRTPWYAKNLQVFQAPGTGARFRPIPIDPVPSLVLTMRTANRAPHPNYVGGTIQRLIAQGIDPAAIHLCATHPNVHWLERELAGAAVSLHVPEQPLSPNENGLAQIRVLDPHAADWALLLEDDLAFCADFVGSVQRWLVRAARPDRHVYRLFGFRLRPPTSKAVTAYDWPLKNLCGSQAVLLRMDEAQDFLAWGDANLLTWGGFRGNARIAFDKLLASWALARWPGVPGVVSHPLFVQHVGDVSSLHPSAARMDHLFAGPHWSYRSLEASL